jgi:hypothetical protein
LLTYWLSGKWQKIPARVLIHWAYRMKSQSPAMITCSMFWGSDLPTGCVIGHAPGLPINLVFLWRSCNSEGSWR